MKNIYLSIFVLTLIQACTSSSNQTKESVIPTDGKHDLMDMLKGKWLFINQKDTGMEIWTKMNDSLFVGKSISVSGKDTGIDEIIELRRKNNLWDYCALVDGQNNGQWICFALKTANTSMLEFTNPQHNYPQRLLYEFHSPDSITIEVSGLKGIKKQTFTLQLKRLKE